MVNKIQINSSYKVEFSYPTFFKLVCMITFVYSRFPPKIQFLCWLLSSLSLVGATKLGIKEKIFEI